MSATKMKVLSVALAVAAFIGSRMFISGPAESHLGPLVTISFQVTGTAPAVDVTYWANPGSATSSTVTLPFSVSVQVPAGSFVEVDAVLTSGDVECTLVGSHGQVIAQQRSAPTTKVHSAAYCQGTAA